MISGSIAGGGGGAGLAGGTTAGVGAVVGIGRIAGCEPLTGCMAGVAVPGLGAKETSPRVTGKTEEQTLHRARTPAAGTLAGSTR